MKKSMSKELYDAIGNEIFVAIIEALEKSPVHSVKHINDQHCVITFPDKSQLCFKRGFAYVRN